MNYSKHSLSGLVCVCAWMVVGGCTSDTGDVRTQQGYLDVEATVNAVFMMSDGKEYVTPAALTPEAGKLGLTVSCGAEYSHRWASLAEYNSEESVTAGTYDIRLEGRASASGPRFGATAQAVVQPGSQTVAHVECGALDAMTIITTRNTVQSAYTLESVTVHSETDNYSKITAEGTPAAVYSTPGSISLYAGLSSPEGKKVLLSLQGTTDIDAAHGVQWDMSCSPEAITMTAPGLPTMTADITPAIFDTEMPVITPAGFTPGTPVECVEGITLAEKVTMKVASERPLKSLYVSTNIHTKGNEDIKAAYDLLNLTASDNDFLNSNGLHFEISSDGLNAVIDFTGAIENTAMAASTETQFNVMAVNDLQLCSEPMTLDVRTTMVNLTLSDIQPAALGVNKAKMHIHADADDIERQDFSIYALDDGHLRGAECPILDWKKLSAQDAEVTFMIPDGGEPVKIGVDYLGLQKAEATVERCAPEYTVEIDAFATTALLNFKAETEEIEHALTQYATFMIDGQKASVWHRYENRHIVLLNGLTGNTKYTLQICAGGDAPDKKTVFVTEKVENLPGGDNFGDWRVLFDVKDIPSGGRYSSTFLSIVNHQNYANFKVEWPKKHWASINAKTFDRTSRNINTWYLQPSAKMVVTPSGSRAIELTSVGWSHDGAEIPDYVQKEGESLPYNNNVPRNVNRSAGRLFLGSYDYNSFSGTGEIREGLPFTSRPSSLNGFFKYLPDLTRNDDTGYVRVQLVNRGADGTERIIAEGRYVFYTSPDYRAFNVPLEYESYGVKATHIKIMFASSVHTDSDVAQPGDITVPVTAYPEKGAYVGSTLWVNNLSLSY